MKPLRVAIAGAPGRMGRALVRLVLADECMTLAGAYCLAEDPLLGRDAGEVALAGRCGVPLSDVSTASPPRDAAAPAADVLIDFTSPAGARFWAGWCAARGVALLSGTTGLRDAERAALAEAARSVPVLWAPNMSVGVHALLRLVQQAAALLGAEWQVEIVETHHDQKADAPSGTARALLERVCQARGVQPDAVVRHGREGLVGPRRPDEIGMHAVRMGSVVGEHTVSLATATEIVTLEHRALSRDVFAAGALRAARWLAGRPPGSYTIGDVLAVPAS